MRKARPAVTGFEDGKGLWAKECGWPLQGEK